LRKNALRIFGLFFTLAALLTSVPRAQAQDPLCPACIVDYKCCIKGGTAKCIPADRNC
jgi:hypothetical protein